MRGRSSRAGGSATGSSRCCARSTRAPRRTCSRSPSYCGPKPRCSTSWSRACSGAQPRLSSRGCGSCTRRCAGSWSSGSPIRRRGAWRRGWRGGPRRSWRWAITASPPSTCPPVSERSRCAACCTSSALRTPAHKITEMDDDPIGEILVPADDLARRVRELAADISRDYAGRDLVLIGVLKGAVFFLSDLMRHLEVPCEVDFMAVASYGSATKSSGVVRILKDLDAVIEGRDVLIVEDIVDSGLTLQYLLRNLGARNPRSLEVCALLTKPERRKVDLPTRYVGFEIPNRFAIGYGLDHLEQYRNLPYVAALNE